MRQRNSPGSTSADLYSSQGAEAVGNTPAEFTAFVRSEQAKWSKIIKAVGVKLD